jgi:hypothetical protein
VFINCAGLGKLVHISIISNALCSIIVERFPC